MSRELIIRKNASEPTNPTGEAYDFGEFAHIKRISGLGTSWESEEDYQYADGFIAENGRKQAEDNIIVDILYFKCAFDEHLRLSEWLQDAKNIKLEYRYETREGWQDRTVSFYRDVSLMYYTHDDIMYDGSGSASLSFKCLTPWYQDIRGTTTDTEITIPMIAKESSIMLSVELTGETAIPGATPVSISIYGGGEEVASVGGIYSYQAGDVIEYSSLPENMFIKLKREGSTYDPFSAWLVPARHPFARPTGNIKIKISAGSALAPLTCTTSYTVRSYRSVL